MWLIWTKKYVYWKSTPSKCYIYKIDHHQHGIELMEDKVIPQRWLGLASCTSFSLKKSPAPRNGFTTAETHSKFWWPNINLMFHDWLLGIQKCWNSILHVRETHSFSKHERQGFLILREKTSSCRTFGLNHSCSLSLPHPTPSGNLCVPGSLPTLLLAFGLHFSLTSQFHALSLSKTYKHQLF